MREVRHRITSAILASALFAVILHHLPLQKAQAETSGLSFCAVSNNEICPLHENSCDLGLASAVNEAKHNEMVTPVHAAGVAVLSLTDLATPSATPEPTPTLAEVTTPPGASNNPDVILDLINAHRAQIGLAALQKDERVCQIAATRVPEIPGEVASGAFHSGLYADGHPFWITENMKYGSDEAGTVQWWLNSPIHRSAIEGSYTFSCGTCVGNACIQLFTNFTPK